MAWITKEKRLAIYRRDEYRCAYCGRTYPMTRLTLDHVHPRAQGGSNKATNLVTACDDCNNRKRNRTLAQYEDYCRKHIRRTIRWDIIRARIASMRMRKLVFINGEG